MTDAAIVAIIVVVALVALTAVVWRRRQRRSSPPPATSPSFSPSPIVSSPLVSALPLVSSSLAAPALPLAEGQMFEQKGPDPSEALPLPEVSSSSSSSPLQSSSASDGWTPRTGDGGRYADALILFDRAHQWFARSMSESYITAGFPECSDDVDHEDYFITLLVQLSDHGATTYTTSSDDELIVTTFEAWLELFGSNVLDVMSARCSTLLERGADNDTDAQAVGGIYLEVLRTLIPDALAVVGYAAVEAFPLCGAAPNTETMRVVGTASRPSHAGRIFGVRQYGLMKGRKLVRHAHVTVG